MFLSLRCHWTSGMFWYNKPTWLPNGAFSKTPAFRFPPDFFLSALLWNQKASALVWLPFYGIRISSLKQWYAHDQTVACILYQREMLNCLEEHYHSILFIHFLRAWYQKTFPNKASTFTLNLQSISVCPSISIWGSLSNVGLHLVLAFPPTWESWHIPLLQLL